MEFNPGKDLKIDKRLVFQTLFEEACRKLRTKHNIYADFIDAGRAFEENGLRATRMTGDSSEEIMLLWDAVVCYMKANVIAHKHDDTLSIRESAMFMEKAWNRLRAYSSNDNPILVQVFGGHDEVIGMLRTG